MLHFKNVFVYCLWLSWVLTAAQAFSLLMVIRDYFLVVVCGLLIAVASLVVKYRIKGMWVSAAAAPRL